VAQSRREDFAPGQEHELVFCEFLYYWTLVNGNVGGEKKQSLFFFFFNLVIIKRENPSACPCVFFSLTLSGSFTPPLVPHISTLAVPPQVSGEGAVAR
jgi:hypothetical protein